MKLTLEQIKAVTYGAVFFTEEADGIHFFRHSREQIEAYNRLSVAYGERALSTTGIRLDFETDSKLLHMKVATGEKFEIYLNGILRVFFETAATGGEIEVKLCDPYGAELEKCRVTVYLPCHKPGVIASLELDDGCYVKPHPCDKSILFTGDSITQGWDAKHDSLCYAHTVSRFFNANSINQAVGGMFFDPTILERIDLDPDIIIVAYGTNDYVHYRSVEELKHNCEAFLDKLCAFYGECKNMFLISPIWRDYPERDGRCGVTFSECRAVIIEAALRRGLKHIDGLSLMPPEPAYFADGFLHPNEAGFQIYAHNLLPQLCRGME